MKNTTNSVEYSQLRIEDYLLEKKLEAERKAGVYSGSTMYEKEGDGVKVEEGICKNGALDSREEESLLEIILSPDNLNIAYKKVKGNKGSHGVDGMTVDELLGYLRLHGEELRRTVLEGSYKPQPVRRVEIPKPDGGIRLLGIPSVIECCNKPLLRF